jgi:hypothetical protein
MKTINVIEILDNEITYLSSFPYTQKGRKKANAFAEKLIFEGCAGDGPTDDELDGIAEFKCLDNFYRFHPKKSTWYVFILSTETAL